MRKNKSQRSAPFLSGSPPVDSSASCVPAQSEVFDLPGPLRRDWGIRGSLGLAWVHRLQSEFLKDEEEEKKH